MPLYIPTFPLTHLRLHGAFSDVAARMNTWRQGSGAALGFCLADISNGLDHSKEMDSLCRRRSPKSSENALLARKLGILPQRFLSRRSERLAKNVLGSEKVMQNGDPQLWERILVFLRHEGLENIGTQENGAQDVQRTFWVAVGSSSSKQRLNMLNGKIMDWRRDGANPRRAAQSRTAPKCREPWTRW